MLTRNEKTDGYRGIWYACQEVGPPYVYKYSGGLGTYCAKHSPFAVYAREEDKTFFCFGGVSPGYHRRPIPPDGEVVRDALLHVVGCYDHRTGLVSRPTVLLDKETTDAHDNPVISLDGKGYVWIFSTAHGTSRPSYIHRSVRPYDIDEFRRVEATRKEDGSDVPLDNFSYMQVRHLGDRGFEAFMTRYGEPAVRTPGFIASGDGRKWSAWEPLAAIEEGHYQVSETTRERAGTAFNYHPDGQGVNFRTNLYYMESTDGGATWHSAAGEELAVPLTAVENPALVHDYESEGLKVYMKDIQFDDAGRPIILHITSRGFEPGPENGPRTWRTARWTGSEWEVRPITSSDNSYDMGSLYLEEDGTWRIIGPTEPGPQPYNPGGEMAIWTSENAGATWRKMRDLTADSPRNHTYARRPINAHPDFYALWADGNPRKPSPSRLYFCNGAGDVRMLPAEMDEEWAEPETL